MVCSNFLQRHKKCSNFKFRNMAMGPDIDVAKYLTAPCVANELFLTKLTPFWFIVRRSLSVARASGKIIFDMKMSVGGFYTDKPLIHFYRIFLCKS